MIVREREEEEEATPYASAYLRWSSICAAHTGSPTVGPRDPRGTRRWLSRSTSPEIPSNSSYKIHLSNKMWSKQRGRESTPLQKYAGLLWKRVLLTVTETIYYIYIQNSRSCVYRNIPASIWTEQVKFPDSRDTTIIIFNLRFLFP